jgi:uncharacterized membrane protein required for colicin V production
MNWADLAIAIIVLIGTFKGLKTGFISELAGFIALACGIWTCFSYTGFWDDSIMHITHLGPGSSHAIGALAFGAEVYAIISLVGFLLNSITSSRILKIGNALLGAGVGLGKALIFVWAGLYALLFFPLTDDLRRDLHESTFAAAVTQPNQDLDVKLRDALPDFARLYATPLFDRHHV